MSHPAPHPVPVERRSAWWTGVLLILGALTAGVGAFLPFEEITFRRRGGAFSSIEFGGLGTTMESGEPLAHYSAGYAGRVVLTVAVVVLLLGVLTLLRRGRLSSAAVALVAACLGLLMAVTALLVPKSDATDLNQRLPAGYAATAVARIGAHLATIGSGVALLGALLAIILRPRRA